MKRFLLLLVCLLLGPVRAQDHPVEPRDLGHKAVLNVYWYSPTTLEITHEESMYYKDFADCNAHAPQALAFFAGYASEGDRVAAQCYALSDEMIEKKKPHPGSTDL